MKIIVADKISDRGIALLRDAGWNVVMPTAATLPSEIADADALVVRSATKVTAALLEKAGRLRAIGRAGVGVDNVDVDAATRRGVLVMNTPGGNSVSVAEHTLALMLGLARAVPQANASIHAGKWEKSAFSGTEMRGKTMGLVGLGRVGTEVARRARALEMKVLAHDPFVTPAAAAEVEVELVPLDDLLPPLGRNFPPHLAQRANRKADRRRGHRQNEKGRAHHQLRARRIDRRSRARRSPKIRPRCRRRARHFREGAAERLAARRPAQRDRHAAYRRLHAPRRRKKLARRSRSSFAIILADGTIRNAVNMPALSPDQYRRLRPYLELGERLGSFVAQASPSHSFSRVRIRYAGEPAELGSHMIGKAVLVGALNSVLDEKVNLVNAAEEAAARGVVVEETTRRRERGYPNTVEVSVSNGGREFSLEGVVAQDGSPRILALDGIALESPLEGTLLLSRNIDVPGVIGRIGTALGNLGINVSTFALGRRAPAGGAEALALVGLDGNVSASVVQEILGLPSVTEARLVRLPAAPQASSATS